jgi:uncharacterized protein (UPF0147 family)
MSDEENKGAEETKVNPAIKAAGALVYIYADYFNDPNTPKPPLPEPPQPPISLPPLGSSFEQSIEFYEENDVSSSLLEWFQENRAIMEEWYEKNNKSYKERWKAVAKAELTGLVTRETLGAKVGFVTRVFNSNPIEDVLMPYETYAILDNFGPAVKLKGHEIATREMVEAYAKLYLEFFETGIIQEIVDAIQLKDSDEYNKMLYEAYKGKEPSVPADPAEMEGYLKQKRHYDEDYALFVDNEIPQMTEILKRDLIQSFFQPIGNHTQSLNLSPTEKAVLTIGLDKIKKIFEKNVETQIYGAESFIQAGENEIRRGTDLLKQWIQDNATLLNVISEEKESLQSLVQHQEFSEKELSRLINVLSKIQDEVSRMFREGEKLKQNGSPDNAQQLIEDSKKLAEKGRALERAINAIKKGQEIRLKQKEAIAQGIITAQGNTLENSLKNIVGNPGKFKYISTEQTEEDFEALQLEFNNLTYDDFLPSTPWEKLTSSLYEAWDSVTSAISETVKNIKDFFNPLSDSTEKNKVVDKKQIEQIDLKNPDSNSPLNTDNTSSKVIKSDVQDSLKEPDSVTDERVTESRTERFSIDNLRKQNAENRESEHKFSELSKSKPKDGTDQIESELENTHQIDSSSDLKPQ